MNTEKNTFWKRFRIYGSIAVLVLLIGIYFLNKRPEPVPEDTDPSRVDIIQR